jgi:hypothetical protein
VSRRTALIAILTAVLVSACTGKGAAPRRSPTLTPQPPAGLLPVTDYNDLCGGPACAPRGAVPGSLRRPLHLPTLASGGECPASDPHSISKQFGGALGRGPVYPIIPFTKGVPGDLAFEYPPSKLSIFAGSDWGGQKVLWVIRRTYTGPVLIRGRQLDGPHALGFDGESRAYSELQIPPGTGAEEGNPGGWGGTTSEVRLKAPGCYAFQIDGTTFSSVVVFRAILSAVRS